MYLISHLALGAATPRSVLLPDWQTNMRVVAISTLGTSDRRNFLPRCPSVLSYGINMITSSRRSHEDSESTLVRFSRRTSKTGCEFTQGAFSRILLKRCRRTPRGSHFKDAAAIDVASAAARCQLTIKSAIGALSY
ncbi:hypothetical protein GALMADRAFT_1064806 [Galerina marginata CBS 339.88]|uniref:Uncharacterized protein n=1 Tax=Galerina marginata (strain CBS 339.88) TaxID=685588 RepID=A0A067SJD7_GALM3|nr:hypothetical protein GALMADRAFT_1064806 [Galerina marginata CBS 339.88]